MNFNADVIAQSAANNPLLLTDSTSQISLPKDVALIIFESLMRDLPNLALVCRNWKNMADDKDLCDRIRPIQAFGSKEWKEYIHVGAGVEPPLPRRVYGDLEKGGHLLTFIPDKVKVTKEKGDVEEVLFDSLHTIGQLIEKLNIFKGEFFTSHSHKEAILQKREPEKPHWVWLDKKAIGKGKSYEQQLEIVKMENKKIPGTKVSRFMDTAISILVEYARSGERNFLNDPLRDQYTVIRVSEQDYLSGYEENRQLTIGFYPQHLDIAMYRDAPGVGCALARKSF